jgi:hypothetical protein
LLLRLVVCLLIAKKKLQHLAATEPNLVIVALREFLTTHWTRVKLKNYYDLREFSSDVFGKANTTAQVAAVLFVLLDLVHKAGWVPAAVKYRTQLNA